jgi:hypothetical protein
LRYIKAKGRRVYSEEPDVRNLFKQINDANESFFVAMRDQILSESDDSNELPYWIGRWKTQCLGDIGSRLDRGIPSHRIYFELSNLVCQQLGYDDKFQSLVDFVVHTTMNTAQ